jgi:hypothetical protein
MYQSYLVVVLVLAQHLPCNDDDGEDDVCLLQLRDSKARNHSHSETLALEQDRTERTNIKATIAKERRSPTYSLEGRMGLIVLSALFIAVIIALVVGFLISMCRTGSLAEVEAGFEQIAGKAEARFQHGRGGVVRQPPPHKDQWFGNAFPPARSSWFGSEEQTARNTWFGSAATSSKQSWYTSVPPHE